MKSVLSLIFAIAVISLLGMLAASNSHQKNSANFAMLATLKQIIQPVNRVCTAEQAEWVAAQEPISNSFCPYQKHWMDTHVKSSHRNADAILVSIGCNRGDDMLLKMREWSRNASYSFKAAEDDYAAAFAGVVRSCPLPDEVVLQQDQEPRPVRGYCVEAMTSTFNAVKSIVDKHGWHHEFRLIQAAGVAYAEEGGTVLFPVSFAGTEYLGIGMDNSEKEQVPALTLDGLVTQNGIKHIDVLSIDAEGYDYEIIRGGLKAALPITRFLEFEYHVAGKWASSDLQELIKLLDHMDFDCYWQGNQGQLWRLTGCWHNSYYPKRDWSNIACARRQELWLHAAMEVVAVPVRNTTTC